MSMEAPIDEWKPSCAIAGQWINVVVCRLKIGLPNAQIFAYIKEQEKSNSAIDKARSRSHPLAEKGSCKLPTRPSSTALIVAARHLFLATLSSQEDNSPAFSQMNQGCKPIRKGITKWGKGQYRWAHYPLYLCQWASFKLC